MQKYINKKKAILLLAVLALYVVIITPLLIISLQKKQELRGKAQTTITAVVTPGQSCGNVPADIMLIIDRSSSMGGVNKLTEAKQAAKSFTDVIAQDSNNRIGLISFSTTATLNNGLTNDFTTIKNKIDTLSSNGSTCHECAIAKANQEIAANGRSDIKKVIVILTDGQANYIIGGTNQADPTTAESKALSAVMDGFNTSKTIFFTIGFGMDGQTGNNGYNGTFLQAIATLTGGKNYYPAPGELQTVYQEISELIGKGLLGGFIFNDLNGNGVFDSNELMLSDWNVQLISSDNTQTFTTDANGTYTITGLCDGNYQLKEVLQSGWQQTLPTDPNGYSIIIANGNSFTDKNFGNMIAPTATPNPTPATTFLDLTIYEHGIGNSGDNTNPTDTNLSNKNPLHKTIDADLELFNSDNQLIGQGLGPLTYNNDSGNFKGTVEIYPNTFASGNYYLKVKTPSHLKRLVPDILTITSGQTNTVPAATLVTGDANNDNRLDILDYNLLLGCYSDLAPAISCDANKKTATDFNDDSFVNQIDYNLFLREIATQPGQ